MGLVANFQAVLGEDYRFWLVPTPPDDDALESCRGGLSFHPAEHEELMTVLRRLGMSGVTLLSQARVGRAVAPVIARSQCHLAVSS